MILQKILVARDLSHVPFHPSVHSDPSKVDFCLFGMGFILMNSHAGWWGCSMCGGGQNIPYFFYHWSCADGRGYSCSQRIIFAEIGSDWWMERRSDSVIGLSPPFVALYEARVPYFLTPTGIFRILTQGGSCYHKKPAAGGRLSHNIAPAANGPSHNISRVRVVRPPLGRKDILPLAPRNPRSDISSL